MVAIHIPRRAEEWGGGPVAAPIGPTPVSPPAPLVRPARLPDRATRFRRRRLAALVLVVAVAAAGAVGVRALAGLTEVGGTSGPRPVEAPSAPMAGQRYVVQPGDTLWTIALRVAPDEDPREVVAALREANGGDPMVEAGTQLTLAID
jgi:hypothetical protein